MVVMAGLAATVAPLVVFNPVPGLQLNILLPPEAVRFTLCPWQIVALVGVISNMLMPIAAAMLKVQLSPLNPSIIK